MTDLLKSTWRDARDPGKGRDGKRTEDGLEAHLIAVHRYARNTIAARTVIERVFAHEREHPFPRGHA